MVLSVEKERLDYIDCAKGIGILCVVFAHHIQNVENLIWWCNSFSMPLFFLISGYLYGYRKKEVTVKQTIHAGLRNFIWPYCTFSIIIIFWWIVLGYMLNTEPDLPMVDIVIRFLTTYGYHALWFLPTMFQVSCASKIVKNEKRWMIILLSVFIGCTLAYLINYKMLFEGFERWLAIYFGRFWLGLSFVEIGRYLYAIERKINSYAEWIILIGTLCISVLLYRENILVSMVFCRIGNPIMYYLISCSGSIFIILIAKKIVNFKMGRKLCFWGKNSLIIMAVHMDISIEIVWIVMGCTNLSAIVSFRNLSIIVVLIELIVLFVIVKIINQYVKILILFPKKDNCNLGSDLMRK